MRAYRVLVVMCLLAGAVLRARGYLFASRAFWVDEAAWAIRLLKLNLLEPSIRPVGFMAVVRLLVACFGERDIVLRLLPWLAGVGTTLLAVPLAETMLPTRAGRLLFIGAVALHPVAIDYSKEFKPYSVSLFLHVLCTLLAAKYLRNARTSSLVYGIVTGFLGIWFAQDLIFALPGFYLVTGALAFRNARWSQLKLLALGAAGTLAMIACLYFFFWRAVDVGPHAADTAFWGNKYDVFHEASTGEGLLHWIGRKYLELAAFPAARREYWLSDAVLRASVMGWLSTLYAALWVLLHAAGLMMLVRERRHAELTLFLAPVATLLAFNLLGLWPFAVFRTNLFLLAYVCLIASFGLGAVRPLVEKEATVPLIIAVVLPLVVFERDWHRHKRWAGESAFFDVTKALVKLQGRHPHENDPLLLDHKACTVFRYYLKFNPDYAKLRRRLDERFTTKCRNDGALTEAEQEATDHRVFLVLDDPAEGAATLDRVASLSTVVDFRRLDEGRDVVFEFAPSGARAQ